MAPAGERGPERHLGQGTPGDRRTPESSAQADPASTQIRLDRAEWPAEETGALGKVGSRRAGAHRPSGIVLAVLEALGDLDPGNCRVRAARMGHVAPGLEGLAVATEASKQPCPLDDHLEAC